MSDYYSAVRLQLELDELMAQIVKLQARIKDIDIKGLDQGWRDLMRDIQRRSRRLQLRRTSDGISGVVLEVTDNPQAKVKVADINRALEELCKKGSKGTVTVVEIDQEIDYEDEGPNSAPEILEEDDQQAGNDESRPEKAQSEEQVVSGTNDKGIDHSTEELDGQTLQDSPKDDVVEVDLRDLIEDLQGDDDKESLETIDEMDETQGLEDRGQSAEQIGTAGIEGDSVHGGPEDNLAWDSTEELEGQEVDVRDLILESSSDDEEMDETLGLEGEGELSEDSSVEEIPRLESEPSSDEEEIDEMRVVHVVYDPDTKSFVEKEEPSEEIYEEMTDTDSSEAEMAEVDDICQITWAEMRREVGPALTKRCKAYCRQLQAALQQLESNIEAVQELIQALNKLEKIIEENYRVFVQEKDKGANARTIAMYRYLVKEMVAAKGMVGQLARALPQLEAERETAWPYEEGRPFPNAWPEEEA